MGARDDAGEPMHYFLWALDRSVERVAFEVFIDEVMTRWQQYPGMHVYHYAAYEPAALKRLAGATPRARRRSTACCAAAVRRSPHVVRNPWRASVEEYSIKKLEPVFGYARQQSLLEAGVRLRAVQRALELGSADAINKPTRQVVEAYNRDDCMSAMALRDWLERERLRIESEGVAVPRPIPRRVEPSEELSERDARTRHLADTLLTGMPADPQRRTAEQGAIYTLAHLLEFHRREEKAPWWEYFDLQRKSDEELMDESGPERLEFVERRRHREVARAALPVPEAGDEHPRRSQVHAPLPDGREVGTSSESISRGARWTSRRMVFAEEHPRAVFSHKMFSAPKQAEALMRLGGWVADHGVTAPGDSRGAGSLLRLPRAWKSTPVEICDVPAERIDAATARRRWIKPFLAFKDRRDRERL